MELEEVDFELLKVGDIIRDYEPYNEDLSHYLRLEVTAIQPVGNEHFDVKVRALNEESSHMRYIFSSGDRRALIERQDEDKESKTDQTKTTGLSPVQKKNR